MAQWGLTPLTVTVIFGIYALAMLLARVLQGLTTGAAIGAVGAALSLPRATREPLLLALPVLVAVWALAGFYGSLGPMLMRSLLGSNTPLLGVGAP
jgi:hypothetical protein